MNDLRESEIIIQSNTTKEVKSDPFKDYDCYIDKKNDRIIYYKPIKINRYLY